MSSTFRLLIIFFLILVISESALRAQITQPQRFEVEVKSTDDIHNIFSADEMGLLMYRESSERGERGMKKWEFTSIDTDLKARWTKLYDIDLEYDLLGYAYGNKNAFYLFRAGLSIKDDFVIIAMDVVTGDTVHHMVKKLIPMELTHFEVVGNTALIGGVINYRPTIVHYDFRSEKSKVIPGIYRGESEILELKIDQKSKTFNVLITEKTNNRLLTISLMSFDEDGVLLQNTKLKTDDERSLIFAGSTPFKDDEIMVTGTYSRKRSSYSRGIFIAKIDATGNQDVAYYSYADLENFFKYMPARREARVKKRIERKKIQGKKARFTYRLLVREVIEKDGNYVMVGEAFYPRYHNNSIMGGFNNPFGTYRGSNFVGYKFTHAIVIGFNSEGEVLWDNSFEINDVERYTLDEVVNVGVEDDKVVLLYLYDGEIRSKIIEGKEVLEGKSAEEIRLSNEGDVAKTTMEEYGGLDKWYGSYFYAYGVQRIKSKSGDPYTFGKEVFFINKISYE